MHYGLPMRDFTRTQTKLGDGGPSAPVVTLRKRFRLFITVVAVVVFLSLLKAGIHWVGLS